MPSSPIMVCDVCRVPLDTREEYRTAPPAAVDADNTGTAAGRLSRPEDRGTPTGVTYRHPAGIQADHEPVPVLATALGDAMATCDFCGEAAPVSTWSPPPGASFRTAALDGDVHEWATDWAACETCSAFIEHRQVEALVERWRRTSERAGLGDRGLPRSAAALVEAAFIAFIRSNPAGPFRI